MRPISPSAISRPLSLVDDELAGGLDDVRVEAAAQAAVAGDHDQQRPALSGGGDAQQRVRVLIDARYQAVEHVQHPLRERPRRDDALLRAPQARGRDHLHRLGDLLRRLDRADPATEVDQ